MLANKRILLLEDDVVDVMTIKRAISQLHIPNELIVKENGEEGLEYLKQCKNLPGLIFLDINMPKMNGIEFLQNIKLNSQWAKIPVIILTTSKDQQDKLATFNQGISGYMVKPVDYSQFKDMIGTIKEYWNLSEHPY
ncbi:MAG: response regulator [Bacteroidia bacterium]|nr:response regulator [Bacteroidia bacterium]NNJ56194.1 response regulator [Bacteroidia bacterium]